MRSRESNGELANAKIGSVDLLEAYQVVSEELHNEGRVLVALLAQSVEFCDDKLDTMINTGRKRKTTYQQWHRQRQAWPNGKPGQES